MLPNFNLIIKYNGDNMVDQVFWIAKKLGVNFDNFTLDDLLTGVDIESEHGSINPVTNVTNDNLETTVKIALAHLYEFPNYYNKEYGLSMFEEFLKQKQ